MSETPFPRRQRWYRLAMPMLVLVFASVVGQLGTALANVDTFYLEATGVPYATANIAPPSAGPLSNFDPGRDNEPGRVVAKGGSSGETDPSKFQQWTVAVGPFELDGEVKLSFWSAMKDFANNKKGSVRALLLDCDLDGQDCTRIDGARRTRGPWSNDSGWVHSNIYFEEVEYNIATGRTLSVRIIVRDKSHDDMWFAYDTAAFPSSLSMETASAPPPTTTTTTTPPSTTTTPTTTTSPPPTTTTTTTRPPPTTTTSPPPTTTTTRPPAATTTTTTQPAAAATTTTTTLVPPEATGAPPTGNARPRPPSLEDQPPQQDVAMAPLPAGEDGGNRGGLSTTLLDGLDLVIPPSVASSLLSPLLLLESIAGAFTETGRDLILPALILIVGVLWTEGRRRRDSETQLDGTTTGVPS